jgi:DNA-binding response OmpR family regulator
MGEKLNFEIVPLTEIISRVKAPEGNGFRPVVLVVDDEIVIADTLAAILNRNGMAAMAAYDGRSALDIARTIPPNLLLTDIVMPDMNGIELAIAVQEEVADCKILLFSGQAATVDLLTSAQMDGHNFAVIAKPIHPKELIAHISESLQSQAAHGQTDAVKPSPGRATNSPRRNTG